MTDWASWRSGRQFCKWHRIVGPNRCACGAQIPSRKSLTPPCFSVNPPPDERCAVCTEWAKPKMVLHKEAA